jgi:ABC-type sulfate/molybdate transport systems ATPase subunit
MSEHLPSFFGQQDVSFTVEMRDVSLAYGLAGGAREGFSLEIPAVNMTSGSLSCIYGTNGSGKSTLLRAMAGLIEPRRGSVRWQPREHIVPGVDFVLLPAVGAMPHWNVRQNIIAPLEDRGLARDVVAARAAELVELLGLQGLEQRPPHRLSTGQQQRTVLARALGLAAPIMLLDEVMSGQSEYWATRIAQILRSLVSRGGLVVMISHDPDWVAQYADSVLNLAASSDVAAATARYHVGFHGDTRSWQEYRAGHFAS